MLRVLTRPTTKGCSWPNCELNTQEIRQQIGSACRSTPELFLVMTIWVASDPKQNSSLALVFVWLWSLAKGVLWITNWPLISGLVFRSWVSPPFLFAINPAAY
jgi:hypothetical protein